MNTTTTRYAMRLHTVSVVCDHAQPDKDGIIGYQADKPENAGRLVLDLLATVDPDGETFGIVTLDGRHRVTGFKLLTQGTRTQAPVDGRKLFRAAMKMDAVSVILFHNHPSGDPEPSRQDLDLTRRLVLGGKVVGIDVVDHILTTPNDRWVSLRSTRADVFSDA